MKTTTDALCALAAHLAYEDQDSEIRTKIQTNFEGWSLLSIGMPANDHGYRGRAYHNKTTNEVVIAHRGMYAVADSASIRAIYEHKTPPAVASALYFSTQVRKIYIDDPETSFVETGHSLGAVLATYVAYLKNSRAVVFDSPGCAESLRDDPDVCRVENDSRDDLITTYLAAPNGINTAAGQLGTVIRIYIPYIESDGKRYSDLSSSFNLALVSAFLKGYMFTICSQFAKLATLNIGSYIQKQHGMGHIFQAFDMKSGSPYLAREVTDWPTLKVFNNWLRRSVPEMLARDFRGWLQSNPNIRKYNHEMEKSFSEIVKFGAFITPSSESFPSEKERRRYGLCVNNAFNNFHDDQAVLANIGNQLGVEMTHIPLKKGSTMPELEKVLKDTDNFHRKIAVGGGVAAAAATGALIYLVLHKRASAAALESLSRVPNMTPQLAKGVFLYITRAQSVEFIVESLKLPLEMVQKCFEAYAASLGPVGVGFGILKGGSILLAGSFSAGVVVFNLLSRIVSPAAIKAGEEDRNQALSVNDRMVRSLMLKNEALIEKSEMLIERVEGLETQNETLIDKSETLIERVDGLEAQLEESRKKYEDLEGTVESLDENLNLKMQFMFRCMTGRVGGAALLRGSTNLLLTDSVSSSIGGGSSPPLRSQQRSGSATSIFARVANTSPEDSASAHDSVITVEANLAEPR